MALFQKKGVGCRERSGQ